jgi:hypothetical protein
VLHTKALYNLLRIQVRDDRTVPHEKWAVEDLRICKTEDLFDRLALKGVHLDPAQFLFFADSVDTPEDLTDVLLSDADQPDQHDPLYLIIFELWRRLLPQKSSLSIFCDELDHLIELYDADKMDNDEPLQDSLANFLEILEQNTDVGIREREVFASIEPYCAHNIEDFLYDFISDVLDAQNLRYASELIEGFAPYIPAPIWFEILAARLEAFTNPEEANERIGNILKLKPDLSALLEILRVLSTAGDHVLFINAAKQTLPLLETEEDFREMALLVSDYYRLLDQDAPEQAIEKLMQKRKSRSDALNPQDPDLKAFAALIK